LASHLRLPSSPLCSAPLPCRRSLQETGNTARRLLCDREARGPGGGSRRGRSGAGLHRVAGAAVDGGGSTEPRTVVELAPSGTLSVVGPHGWPLGVGARFVGDAAGASALCLTAAEVAAPDAPSSAGSPASSRGGSRRGRRAPR
ncbi:unnamed protein product, partial [Urochloa humidicola]